MSSLWYNSHFVFPQKTKLTYSFWNDFWVINNDSILILWWTVPLNNKFTHACNKKGGCLSLSLYLLTGDLVYFQEQVSYSTAEPWLQLPQMFHQDFYLWKLCINNSVNPLWFKNASKDTKVYLCVSLKWSTAPLTVPEESLV